MMISVATATQCYFCFIIVLAFVCTIFYCKNCTVEGKICASVSDKDIRAVKYNRKLLMSDANTHSQYDSSFKR
jgi:hypothetical protein